MFAKTNLMCVFEFCHFHNMQKLVPSVPVHILGDTSVVVESLVSQLKHIHAQLA